MYKLALASGSQAYKNHEPPALTSLGFRWASPGLLMSVEPAHRTCNSHPMSLQEPTEEAGLSKSFQLRSFLGAARFVRWSLQEVEVKKLEQLVQARTHRALTEPTKFTDPVYAQAAQRQVDVLAARLQQQQRPESALGA